MGIRATLEERMVSEAEFGLFYIYARISKKKASELRRIGFSLLDSKESKRFPRTYRISWEWNIVDGDLSEINENSDEYTFPKKLWLIAAKASTVQ